MFFNVKNIILKSYILLVFLTVSFTAFANDVQTPGSVQTSTADHSLFKDLQKTFTSGPEVTKACLGCHTEAGNADNAGVVLPSRD